MYDTKFIVRYHDIQEELVLILKKEEEERGVKPVEEDNRYYSQDILDICNKLYRDELCSVFYAEDIMDDKIDKGMKTVLDIMLVNPNFKAIIDKKKVLNHEGVMVERQIASKAILELQAQSLESLFIHNISHFAPASHFTYRAKRAWSLMPYYFNPQVWGDRYQHYIDQGPMFNGD